MTDNHRDESPEPADWDLLARNPIQFFQLQEGFDRKDLKRSYNRLLRQYKPEKFPQEFQRIRGAYEELERQLRYGQANQQDELNAWKDELNLPASEAKKPAESASSEGDQESLPASSEPLQQADPRSLESIALQLTAGDANLEELYFELQDRTGKTPPEYYALSLLADFVEPDKPLAFLGWLLAALKEWPNDQGISSLVYQYLNAQVAESHLSKVLVACSKAVSNDGFYALTEGAWDRLMRLMPFPKFLETLQECEANLQGDTQIAGRLTFYLHTLRYAQWAEPSDWPRQTLDYLENNYEQIPPHLEGDLDLLVAAQEYIEVREVFVNSAPLCKRLDHVLKLVFTEDVLVADRAMVDCQLDMLEAPNQIYEAFSPEQQPATVPFFTLWNWVSYETANRFSGHEESEIDYQFWGERMSGWLEKLLAKQTWLLQQWNFLGACYRIVKFVVVAVAFLLMIIVMTAIGMAIERSVTDGSPDFVVSIFVAFALTAVGLRYFIGWWFPFLTDKVWQPYCQRMGVKCYSHSWRPACSEFIDRSQLDYFSFRGLLQQIYGECSHQEAIWVNSYVQQDIGLAVYAAACRFQE